MKKPLVLCMSMALAVALAGCATTNNVEKPSQSPTPKPTESAEISSSETPEVTGIPGSFMKDIQLGVAKFGMDDASAEGAPDGAEYRWGADRMWTFPNTNISLDYSIRADSDRQLISGSFGATWDGVVDNDVFCDAAETYLSFIATMPYDTAEPQAAKQWVIDNMDNVEGENSVSTTIGDATFSLFGSKTDDGTPSSYWLKITNKE